MKLSIRVSCFCLILYSTAFAQQAGLPPLAKDAFENEGTVVSKYDKFTDKSKIEFLTMIQGTKFSGFGLLAVTVFDGQTPSGPLEAVLALVRVGEESKYKETEPLILLIDGQRQIHETQRFQSVAAGKVIEVMLVTKHFKAGELAKIANARTVEGRLSGYTEFRLSDVNRKVLADFANKMLPR